MFTPFAFVQSAAPTFVGLLDTYPNASRAYSVRRLNSAYTGPLLRVRRSNDNAEQDISYIGENLDTSALSSFVGANNGFVVTWYDQSGNGVNATQATAGSQPQIVSSGTIQTTGTKTSLLALSKHMDFTAITNLVANTQLLVGKKNSANSNNLIGFADVPNGNSPLLTHFSDSNIYFQWEDRYINTTSTIANINYEVIIAATTGVTTAAAARNGSSLTMDATVSFPSVQTTVNGIMKYGGQVSDSQYQELVLWPSGLSADFTGIQTNVNTYYAIY